MAGEIYQHTQSSGFMLALIGLAVIGALVGISLVGAHLVALFVVAVLLIVALLFRSLTVRVGDGRLHWCFGPGFWKKSVPLTDITAVGSVRNKWWYGWGIRYTPHGWLYNVSGLEAVEINLANGKTFRIGTDEPEQLCEAILKAQRVAKDKS